MTSNQLAELAEIRLTEWARKYGGIFSLKRFTNTTLVVSDRKLIKDLLDKKSNIYSNRPASVVANLITQGDHLLIMDYGETWRKLRKLVHQHFMEAMCEKEHVHVQNAEAIQMVRDFLLDPDNHMLHPKRYSNSITNSLGASDEPVFAHHKMFAIDVLVPNYRLKIPMLHVRHKQSRD